MPEKIIISKIWKCKINSFLIDRLVYKIEKNISKIWKCKINCFLIDRLVYKNETKIIDRLESETLKRNKDLSHVLD